MPYRYVVHLRIFLFIWVVLLPLGIVEQNGWISALWTTIIAYGVIGVERWADELADPFGDDVSDVPLERLCDVVNNVIKKEFDMYHHGLYSLIKTNRPPYQEFTEEQSQAYQTSIPKNFDQGQPSEMPSDVV